VDARLGREMQKRRRNHCFVIDYFAFCTLKKTGGIPVWLD